MTKEEKQKAIDALKISVPVIAMTQEEFNDYIQILNKVMDWLEQESCYDVISRQAALGQAMDYGSNTYLVPVNSIKALPSVTPQPKMGRWIRVDKNKLRCSECEVIHLIAQYPIGNIDWCPNCGAKVEV